MEVFPVVSPSKPTRSSIEERVNRLIELAKSFAQKRASFLQWVTHETGVLKVPTPLESPWQLRQGEFLAVLKKAGLKHPSPATLRYLARTCESESAALLANRTNALRLEREVHELISKSTNSRSTRLLSSVKPPLHAHH